jgi:phage terminase Nu1 subunit (DNA packaging protein)
MNATSALPGTMDRTEFAELLGLSKRTNDDLVTQGLPCVLLGRRTVRFDPAVVVAWVKRGGGVWCWGAVHPM